jgi:hypothetical protein
MPTSPTHKLTTENKQRIDGAEMREFHELMDRGVLEKIMRRSDHGMLMQARKPL